MAPGKASHRLTKLLISQSYNLTKKIYTNINTNDLNCLRGRCNLCRDFKLDLVAIHAPVCNPRGGNSRISCAKRCMMLALGASALCLPASFRKEPKYPSAA